VTRRARKRHSFADLEAIRFRITDDPVIRQAGGMGIVTMAIDEQSNRVQIGVDPFQQEVVDYIEGTYGPAVSVVAQHIDLATCTSRNNCGDPLKAGLGISGPGGACTSNFIYRNSAGTPLLVTAGHCGSGTFYHNGAAIGSTLVNQFYDGSSADAQTISMSSSKKSNYMFKSTVDIPQVTSRRTSDYVGMLVCIPSWYYGVNCGSITVGDITLVYYDVIHIYHARQANFLAWAGDSGGPIYLPTGQATVQAEGILSGTNGPYVNYFSPIWYVQGGLTVCTSLSC
jgi:hypothetical protein